MEFSILSLNCWDLKYYFAKNTKARILAIADALSKSTYDAVCLQEIWMKKHYKLLEEKLKKNLPYSHYFRSGTYGSGMCIFSRHIIEDSFFYQWKINGYWYKIQHADWYGGKGIGVCKIRFHGMLINIYTTHIHSFYNKPNEPDEYLGIRVYQCFEAAQFIKFTSSSADFILVGADLNAFPGGLGYRLVTCLTGLRDAFVKSIRAFEDDSTYFNYNNSYTSKEHQEKKIPGMIIDYIFYSGNGKVNVWVNKYLQPLPNRVPNTCFSFSDHEAIAANFGLEKDSVTHLIIDELLQECTLIEAIDVVIKSLENLKCEKKSLIWTELLVLFFLIFSMIPIAVSKMFGMESSETFCFISHILSVPLTVYFIINAITVIFLKRIEKNTLKGAQADMELLLKDIRSGCSKEIINCKCD